MADAIQYLKIEGGKPVIVTCKSDLQSGEAFEERALGGGEALAFSPSDDERRIARDLLTEAATEGGALAADIITDRLEIHWIR